VDECRFKTPTKVVLPLLGLRLLAVEVEDGFPGELELIPGALVKLGLGKVFPPPELVRPACMGSG